MDVRSVIAENFTGKPVSAEKYKTTEAVTTAVHWNVWECLREFVQNALDEMTPEITRNEEEVRNPILGNDYGIEYDGELWIWDRGRGVMVEEVLITGLSGKRAEMKIKRGEFGEGIKKSIATLLAMGYEVEIYTRRGKLIKPMIGLFSVEGRPVKIVEYLVKAYDNVKMDFGTVVRVKSTDRHMPIARYSPEDFIMTGEPLGSVKDIVYLATPECYEKLPEKIKGEMRGNEFGSYLMNDIDSHCKDVDKPYMSAVVWNKIVDRPNTIAYRDLLLKKDPKKDFKSFFGYNIWSHIPTYAMGRDRTIISSSWLNYIIGDIYGKILYREESRKMADKRIFRLLVNLLDTYNRLGGKGKEIEFDMNLYTYLTQEEIEELMPYFKERFGEKFVLYTSKATPAQLELLKYHGYTPIFVPDNLDGLRHVNFYEDVLRKLKEEEKLFRPIPDEELGDVERITLNKLRKLVEKIYKERIDDLRKIYKEVMGSDLAFITEPPKIMAYDYTKANIFEKNIEVEGHTDDINRIIGISVDALRKSFIESIAILNHELTHYVTGLGDEDPRRFMKYLERVAGVIESMLIEEANIMLGL